MKQFRNLFEDSSGGRAIEYVLLIVMIGLALIAAKEVFYKLS